MERKSVQKGGLNYGYIAMSCFPDYPSGETVTVTEGDTVVITCRIMYANNI